MLQLTSSILNVGATWAKKELRKRLEKQRVCWTVRIEAHTHIISKREREREAAAKEKRKSRPIAIENGKVLDSFIGHPDYEHTPHISLNAVLYRFDSLFFSPILLICYYDRHIMVNNTLMEYHSEIPSLFGWEANVKTEKYNLNGDLHVFFEMV